MKNNQFLTYIKILRAHHWIKNLFLFAAPFFGGTLFREDTILLAFPVFISFSLSASSVYIFNDIVDRQRDRFHPVKKLRPIASGALSPQKAWAFLFILLLPSLYLAYKIEETFFLFVLLYISVQILYSIKFKNIVILDIFCIAAGFVIRVMAGGEAFDVKVSPWLFTTMFMISLVLASGKRLSEANALRLVASAHRESLNHYTSSLLMNVLVIASSASLISYALYTIEQSRELIYTIPVVTFGLFRYFLISEKGLGDATTAILKDRPLAFSIVLWLLMVWILRYNF